MTSTSTARSRVFLAKYFFSNVPANVGIHLYAARLCGGLCGAAVRRADLRPPRRHDRPQIYLPHHHEPDGRRHVLYRRAAGLCDLGHPRADRADRPASGAGPRAWRRIWRRGDLRRRTCAERTSAVTTRPGFRQPRRSACSWRCCWSSASAPPMGEADVCRLGLAHSVPALRHPARRVAVDPAQAQ